MTDFPAAHSMDTTWFAIDADGYVGIFDTSQDGAIPEDLTPFHPDSIEFQSDFLELLAADNGKLIDRSAVDIDFILENATRKNLKVAISELDRLNKRTGQNFLLHSLFLVALNSDIVSQLQQQSPLVIELFRHENYTVLYTNQCNLKWLKNTVESGLIIAGNRGRFLEYTLNLLGWYVYKIDSSCPTPYERQRLPIKPIHLQDLPAEVIQRIRVTELPNLRFAETEAIQPIEHMPCHTWHMTDCWEGTDGEWHEGFPDYSAPTATDLI